MAPKDRNLQIWLPLPADELDTMYDVHKVTLGKSGLTVIMLPDGQRKKASKGIQLSWETFVSYQVTEESFRDDCWVAAPQDAWSFWVGEHSQYLQSFKSTSTLFPDRVLHFLFVGTNLIADILATGYPTIEHYDLLEDEQLGIF